MSTAVGDLVPYHFRLSSDDASSLRSRVAASGLDPGESILSAGPDTLAAWVLAAMAPDVTGARAMNTLGELRGEHGRFGEFLAGIFAAADGSGADKSFALIALSDLIAMRDEDGASAVMVNITAHADDDPRRLEPVRMAFATIGANNNRLRTQAVLPGHALASLALAAAGVGPSVIEEALDLAADSRSFRRAEGHRLSPQEGLTYA